MDNVTLESIQDTAELKAKELSKSLNLEVNEMIFYLEETDEYIVGYLKQPDRNTVAVAYDKQEKYGKLSAGGLLLDCCLIKEESDARILDRNPKYDGTYNWACLEAWRMIQFNASLSKKNINFLKSMTNPEN